MTVIQFSDYRKYREPPRATRRKKVQSMYDLYQLPFFNKKRSCTWDVTPSGEYGRDVETGQRYAIEFLRSCDKSYGWMSLLQVIVTDMIRADMDGRRPDGRLKNNGVVIGFMSIIGEALAHSRVLDPPHREGA